MAGDLALRLMGRSLSSFAGLSGYPSIAYTRRDGRGASSRRRTHPTWFRWSIRAAPRLSCFYFRACGPKSTMQITLKVDDSMLGGGICISQRSDPNVEKGSIAIYAWPVER